MKKIIALGAIALLFAEVALGDGVYTCPPDKGADGAGWNTCSQPLKCLDELPSDSTLVRALEGQNHVLRRWASIPAGGQVRTCRVSDNAALSWNSKAGTGVTSTGSEPTPPPDPAPAPSAFVSVGDTLWLSSAVAGASAYRVYHGTEPGKYAAPIDVQGTSYPLKGYPPGKHYFAMSAVGQDGTELFRSGEKEYVVPEPAPPPTPPAPTVACATPVTQGQQTSVTCVASP